MCAYQDSEIAWSEVRGQAYVKREDMKVEGMDYHRQRERKVWDRLQLLECLLLLGVTLLTGDPDLLPGGEDGVARLPNLVVEVVEGFVPRFLGLEEKEPALHSQLLHNTR